MNFLHPGLALAALGAAALPIVLHLLLRRPRVTPWPSTMLLRLALEKVRRRRRLERWLLLTLRALGIGLIGIAMAGPLATGWIGSRATRDQWIVIDDGATSAERLPDGSTMLDHLKKQALQAIDALHEADRVALVTTAQPATVLMQPTGDLAHARNMVSQLGTRAVRGDLRGALELCLPPGTDPITDRRDVLVFSGWRRGSVDPDQPVPNAWMDRARNVTWQSARPLDAAPGNRFIREVRIGRSTSEVQGSRDVPLRVDLVRTGTTPASDGVVVRNAAGDPLGRADVRWSDQASENQFDLVVKSSSDGTMQLESTPDAQPLDDAMSLVAPPNTTPRVVIVGRRGGDMDLVQMPASTWIQRALEVTGMQPQEIDPASLALRPPVDAETVIVCRPDLLDAAGWSWLGQFVRDGGTTILMPPPDGSSQAWVSEMDRSIGVTLRAEDRAGDALARLAPRQPRTPFFALLGAELDALAEPVSMQRHVRLLPDTSRDTVALAFDQGDAAMLITHPREGLGVAIVLAFTPELAWTDLPLKPFMVPLFQEAVRAGRVMASSQRDFRAGEVAWLGSGARNGLLMPRTNGQPTIEIDAEGRTRQPIPAPGLWKVKQRDGRERWIAVRLDPVAASIERVDEASIESWRRGVGSWRWLGETVESEAVSQGLDSPWTLPLLCVAMACLLVESVLSRFGSPRTQADGKAVTA